MAFLCPVRIRSRAGGQAKKKKNSHGELTESGLTTSEELADNDFNSELPVATAGRITGSSSIETLVRVGLEKENGLSLDARMVVLHDFQPCVDDELEVKRGTVVSVLYRENDWVYVLIENSSKEGFIPHSYCAPYGSPLGDMAKKDLSNDDLSSCNSEVHPFYKDPSGRYMTLYKFVARDENDVNVDRGELITVLNKDDPDWFWVVRSDGQEGFVPSAFVYPLNPNNSEGTLSVGKTVLEDMENSRLSADECHGTELVMLYDYKVSTFLKINFIHCANSLQKSQRPDAMDILY
jgi:hypothetical protein